MVEKPSGGGAGGGKAAHKKAADPRTLFVRFSPPSASITRQHLSDHFSNYGPVNRCSVIRQTKNQSRQKHGEDEEDGGKVDRGSRGYGFVRFVNEEDAIEAAEAIRKKSAAGGAKRKGKGGGGGEIMVVDGVEYSIHAERAVDANTAPAQTDKHVQKKKEKTEKKEKPAAPQPGDRGDKEEEEDGDARYKAESKRKRTSRVIVRNLSFYANEKHVKSVMEANFGPVSAVDLPLVPDLPGEGDDKGKKGKRNAVPRHRGFAFVTFTNANAAKMAVEKGSEVKIKNRLVAIDFSVSKAEHRKIQKEEGSKKEEETESESESDSESDGDENDEEKDGGEKSGSDDDDSSGSDSESEDGDSDSDSDDSEEEGDENAKRKEQAAKPSEEEDASGKFEKDDEANRTLFLRNVPFDATRHDVFELFRKFGRIEAVYLVNDKATGVFKGTAFVRFENEKGCSAAMEASSTVGGGGDDGDESGQQFVSSKNMAMGMGSDGTSGLSLKGRHVLVDRAVDRTTASSLAIERDADGKPIKKTSGKDRRNLYLKNEGRVSSSTDTADARAASARHGGLWEDLPPSDRAKRERAFADKSTKLRSPLFFVNPNRISIRNLAKHVTESSLKKLVFGALKAGLEEKLVTPKDAVAHWKASGEIPHSEVMKRATDPNLVTPPIDEKNMKGSVLSVYVDRDVAGGKKSVNDAPSRGFGFAEFAHHSHALAALRQLNNNPIYSAEFAAGGKRAAEMKRHGKKSKGGKGGRGGGGFDGEGGDGSDFVGEDGRVCVPRLIVEFAVSLVRRFIARAPQCRPEH